MLRRAIGYVRVCFLAFSTPGLHRRDVLPPSGYRLSSAWQRTSPQRVGCRARRPRRPCAVNRTRWSVGTQSSRRASIHREFSMILVSEGFLVRGATFNLRAVDEPWKGDPCEHWSTVVVTAVAYIDNTSTAEIHSSSPDHQHRRCAVMFWTQKRMAFAVAKPLAGTSGVLGTT